MTGAHSTLISQLRLLISKSERAIEDGEVPLCLTPEVLLILNHGFESLVCVSSNDRNNNDLDYLKNVLSSTRYLRLTHSGSSTIQERVDLFAFTHLSQIDIKRIPPHWIDGLERLQDRLTLVRMSRSLNYLQDLLGRHSASQVTQTSATDSCSGEYYITWSRLQKLYLSNNFIKQLDESLKNLPVLEVLDLSQNYLTTTDRHLQCLRDLVHINLAYNSLTVIPEFSTASYTRMKTLVLKANNLENVEGIEWLQNLEILDLSANLLCDHGALTPLHNLLSLKKLYLSENPLANNPRHRILTGALLHDKVIIQLDLDGQFFSSTELRNATNFRASMQPSKRQEQPETSSSEQMDSASSPSLIRKRVKRNVVHIVDIPQPDDDIDNINTSHNFTDSGVVVVDTSKSSPTLGRDHQATMSRIETLRNEFGDSWLRSLSDKSSSEAARMLYKPESVAASSVSVATPSEAEENAAEAAKAPEAAAAAVAAELDETAEKTCYDSIEEEEDGVDTKYGSLYDHDDIARGAHVESDSDADRVSVYSCAESINTDNGIDQSDTFIVSLAGEDSEEFFIMITDTQIIEKNIKGMITEMLDLSALLNVNTVDLDGKPVVKCKFDYFRKDRRERLYVMEDLNEALRLNDKLQPIVTRSQAKRSSINTMECLKCGKRYDINKTAVGVYRNKGSRAVCPYCTSDMVIELGVASSYNKTSTPYGSPNVSTTPPSPTKSVHSNTSSAESGSAYEETMYFSVRSDNMEQMMSLDKPDSAESCRNRSGTEKTESTIEPGSLPSETPESHIHTEDEDEMIKRIVSEAGRATPDDTISYVSLSNEAEESTDSSEDEKAEYLHLIKDNMTGLRFSPTDLTYIDHRLKLQLTVTYFGDDEDPHCVLRCKCVTYSKPEEYPALIVITNLNMYVFRVHQSSNKKGDVSGILDLQEKGELSSINFIEIGLNHNNIRIEFDKTGYCLLLRDSMCGRLLHAKFSELMGTASFSGESQLKSINKINLEYTDQLRVCLAELEDVDERISMNYVCGFLRTDTNGDYDIDTLNGCIPVSLTVDDNNVYVMKEMFYLPFTRGRLLNKQKYFILESRIPISDIAHLRKSVTKPELDIEGFEEQTSEFMQKLLFTSMNSMASFIDKLMKPWNNLYGVELQVNTVG